MPRSSSADRSAGPVSSRLERWPAFPYDVTARISLWLSVLVTAALFGWGAWQRRWIADDGLIVLRTVRNLLAGNGPVFNEGERVEANTSTLWTYLTYFGGVVGGPVRLEYVALALALVLSVAGVVFLMLGAGRLYAPSLQGRRALLLPAGVLVYIAVPPARDFATSGLENGLVLAYLGLLWWMMVCWSQALRAYPAEAVPPALARRGSRPAARTVEVPQHNAVGWFFDVVLAFVAGLSVLVRPELALIGGLALIMMLIAARGWRRRTLIVVAGGLVPVAYQIFRMGYYGLLFPGTALAKDASGNKWAQGWVYLTNFDEPYLLWLPALLLAVLALVLLVTRSRPWWIRRAAPPGYSRLARVVQSPAAVVMFMLVSGLLQALYWIRQGGDFMHGRVLLTPMFCLLAPVAVIPVLLPDGTKFSRGTGYQLAAMTSMLWLAVVGWSLWAANAPGMGPDATRVTYTGIVDERRFYSQATGNRASAHRCGLSGLSTDARGAGRAQQHSRRRAPAAVGQLRPVGRGARGTAAARHATGGEKGLQGPAHSVFHQPRHAGHERRPGRSGDRPDRACESVGRAHRAFGRRAHRTRQESLPRLGCRRGTLLDDASLDSAVSRRGLGRTSPSGAGVPGDGSPC